MSLSIRKKITYGFYLLLVFMIGTAVLTYDIVRQVEQKVVFMEIIDDFLHTTLEVRRFEKNYFLYRQEKDYQETLRYLQRLLELLHENGPKMMQLVKSPDVDQLAEKMWAYRNYMNKLYQIDQIHAEGDQSADRFKLEERIRTIGKELTFFSEQTSLSERASIQVLLRRTREVLVVSIFFLFIVSLAIAAVVGRRVVNSLKILEGYTKQISRGEFVDLVVREAEEEIRSLLTAFNRMSKELKVRQQQLVQSEKLAALGTLLSGVAHELNNPLSNISTSAQILEEVIEEDDLAFKKRLLAQIEEQSDKARDIVRTLLEFSRIKEFKKQKLPLRKMVDETIVLIRGQVPRDVDVVVEIPGDIEIIADKQRLQQVFLNLIKNAMDAIDADGHVWISARELASDKVRNEVEIVIEDDGPGIETENLKRIFDPFFTTKDVGKGSGLGLFVVHDIVDWHGGTIRVESRPGLGTTFIIWLPGSQREEA